MFEIHQLARDFDVYTLAHPNILCEDNAPNTISTDKVSMNSACYYGLIPNLRNHFDLFFMPHVYDLCIYDTQWLRLYRNILITINGIGQYETMPTIELLHQDNSADIQTHYLADHLQFGVVNQVYKSIDYNTKNQLITTLNLKCLKEVRLMWNYIPYL